MSFQVLLAVAAALKLIATNKVLTESDPPLTIHMHLLDELDAFVLTPKVGQLAIISVIEQANFSSLMLGNRSAPL